MTPARELLRQNVEQLAYERGLTFGQIAERGHIAPQTLTRVRAGKGVPLDVIDRIANAIGVPVQELFVSNRPTRFR